MAQESGAVVDGKLRLVRLLARGGMGAVWLAEHLGLRSRVAVKFVDEAMDADAGILARFSREAEVAAKMRSPHVVQILDYGRADGRLPYIVMELLEGESLGTRLARNGRLDVLEVAVIVQQTCKALTRAHALGIIHRDIKPDNVFITDVDGDLFIKILDFGIAKIESSASVELTSTGTTVGTPSYASPEQLLSARAATVSMDLWAVAVTAYRALTGELPFNGETFAALCIAITKGEFRPPTEVRADLPRALDSWFARALDITPGRRFESARELADRFAETVGLGGMALSVGAALPPLGEAAPLETTVASDPELRTATVALPSSSSGRLLTPRASTRASPRKPFTSGSSITGTAVPNSALADQRFPVKIVAAAVLVIGAVGGLWVRKMPPSAPPPSQAAPASAAESVAPSVPTKADAPPQAVVAPATDPAPTLEPSASTPARQPSRHAGDDPSSPARSSHASVASLPAKARVVSGPSTSSATPSTTRPASGSGGVDYGF